MKLYPLKIKIADKAGFCFGVKRAINLAEKAIIKEPKVYTLGPIIHNPHEVARLEKRGIKVLNIGETVQSGSVILRTHGIPLSLYKELERNKSINIIDAVCPFVKKTQNIVKQLSNCSKFKDKNIIIVGEKTHPEVIALVSYSNNKCIVIENENEAQNFKHSSNCLNVVSQTTQTPENLNTIVKILKKRYKINFYNTICKSTLDRQKAARKLSRFMDIILVIGGKNSGNTTRLVQICSEKIKTYHIEFVDDIKKKWFRNINNVGLTAGASTPEWIIERVKDAVKNIRNTNYLNDTKVY
ncbi:MAG: 4-hydroxy-3-methylbut-2-enyl diphosphate reductase [Endomicrobium sp.]|jgi:4-hydroxy-3-methylbut-2-enyl diphosphate reductase|nr:4-hydroxy-3-methylbut-2-enyl diphosphate reductase [Endomicrobium sp.]